MAADHLQLSGRVAIVTGGSRGIGRAVCELLADHGATVVVNYLNDSEAASAVIRSLKEKGVEAIAVQADVGKPSEAHQLIQTTLEQFNRIDVLVCNAGVWEGAPVESISEALWDRALDINLKGTWAVCSAVVPQMKKQQSGKIVIVSSTAGQRGEAGYSNYAASKGGQIAFMKSLAEELGPWRINVNAVAPGWVDTEMTREALGDTRHREEVCSTIPLETIAKPDDIAGPIVFLCTRWARHITGEVINVNGGSVLCG